jgi:hypothetical protein
VCANACLLACLFCCHLPVYPVIVSCLSCCRLPSVLLSSPVCPVVSCLSGLLVLVCLVCRLLVCPIGFWPATNCLFMLPVFVYLSCDWLSCDWLSFPSSIRLHSRPEPANQLPASTVPLSLGHAETSLKQKCEDIVRYKEDWEGGHTLRVGLSQHTAGVDC